MDVQAAIFARGVLVSPNPRRYGRPEPTGTRTEEPAETRVTFRGVVVSMVLVTMLAGALFAGPGGDMPSPNQPVPVPAPAAENSNVEQDDDMPLMAGYDPLESLHR